MNSKTIINHTHPCEINLIWDHNHGIECAKALSFREIDSHTIKQLYSYFEQGHSPSSALHLHRLNLAIELDDEQGELEYVSADRSLNPQYGDVYHLYSKWRIENHGDRNGDATFVKMDEVVK